MGEGARYYGELSHFVRPLLAPERLFIIEAAERE
jgi:hypothetical protein